MEVKTMNNNNSNQANTENTTTMDGYDFSELSNEEITRFPRLYISLDSCSDFYDALCTCDTIDNKNNNAILLFDEGWVFEKSGKYKGIITDLRVSRKSSTDYILDVLISKNQIRYMKFSPKWNDEIYYQMCQYFGSLFISIDREHLRGKIITFDVKNITSSSGNTFSKISNFTILDDVDFDLTLKIIDIMLEQVEEPTD